MFSGLRDPWRRPFLDDTLLRSALSAVETPDGVQASSRHRFKGAIFGRDSIEVGIDVVDHDADLARRILVSVARHIGVRHDPDSEEEPGKGLHEHRSSTVAGQPVEAEQLALLKFLAERWGGSESSVTYFGAADTGALYLKLLERWRVLWGDAILDVTFDHARTGETMSLHQTVAMSAEWYAQNIESSDVGLVEFHRSNPQGIWFQVMRDGHAGMVDAQGNQANPDAPIAAIEIQGVAYSALRAASRLTSDRGLVRRWEALAAGLQTQTLERFWMRDNKYFARALYRTRDNGQVAVVDSFDSSAAELLREEIFDDLAVTDKSRYVGALVRAMYRNDFITDAGVRMLSMQHRHLFDYWTYQGCNVVWPTVVKRVADGLHQQGLGVLGDDMDARILDSCNRAREFPEFFFVDDDGRTGYTLTKDGSQAGMHGVSPEVPMTIQAWTASAAYGAYHRASKPAQAPAPWVGEVTQQVVDELQRHHLLYVDQHEGEERERAFFRKGSAGEPGVHFGLPEG